MAEPSFTTYFSRDRQYDEAGITERGRKKTKVVATLGPATDEGDTLRDMYHAGLNVARLNMSHGNLDDHARRLQMVRGLNKELSRPVAVLADIQGPKIRLGVFAKPKTVWIAGEDTIITTAECSAGDEKRVGTTYSALSEDVRPGDIILVDDGRLRLQATKIDGQDIHCTILVGGVVTSNKGINLPGTNVSAPMLTDKDKEDLTWAIQNHVDYLALSFVSTAQDIRQVRRRIQEHGHDIPIIAKIEREEAVRNIRDIVAEADGIMVARGDLGIEISTERLPVVQKHLIDLANNYGKVVITATQMLESMIHNPIPTRAESSDVANAIFDGTDAVMLSGETAVGKYPAQAVREMYRIAIEAEASPYLPKPRLADELDDVDTITHALAGAADHLAGKIEAGGVLIFSHGAEKTRILSKLRGHGKTIPLCYDDNTWRRLSLTWGTVPLRVDFTEDPLDLLEAGLKEAKRQNVLKDGELLVALMGYDASTASSLRIVTM